jgi:tetratricopeptide (TPR) repeat protein
LKKERRIKLKSSIPVFGVLVISFFISLIPVEGTERPDLESTAKTVFDTEYKSNILRLNFWNASLQMIEENPFIGVGLYKWSGFYPKYHGDYFNDDNLAYVHNTHAHNDFLELGAESGILSALIFLLILVSIAYLIFKKINKNEKYFPLLLSFLTTFAFSFVAFPNHKFSSFFLAAIIAGTILFIPNPNEKQKFCLKVSHLKLLMMILMIFGAITSYIRLQSELKYGEAIYLKERNQFAYMLQKLDSVSEILYPLDASKQPVDYYRAIANYYLGRYPDALNNNLSAHKLAPYNPLIIRNVAGLYKMVGNTKESINYYEQIRQYFPNYINAQINLLYLYSETKQTEKEKILFEYLIKKSPDNPRLAEYKGKITSE